MNLKIIEFCEINWTFLIQATWMEPKLIFILVHADEIINSSIARIDTC